MAQVFFGWLGIGLPFAFLTGIVSASKRNGFWYGFAMGGILMILGLIIVANEDNNSV